MTLLSIITVAEDVFASHMSCVPVKAITNETALLLNLHNNITTNHCLTIDTAEVN